MHKMYDVSAYGMLIWIYKTLFILKLFYCVLIATTFSCKYTCNTFLYSIFLTL